MILTMILSSLCLTNCISRSNSISDTDVKVNSSEAKPAATEAQVDYLQTAIEQAIREGKNVFLVFGSPTCAPCRRLENYLRDSSVHRIFNRYFVVNTFDVIRTTSGKELYKVYWKMGMPSWTILDKERNIIVDSSYPSTGSGNMGYPRNAKYLANFAQALRLGAPEISEAELKILTEKIIYYSSDKDQY